MIDYSHYLFQDSLCSFINAMFSEKSSKQQAKLIKMEEKYRNTLLLNP